MGAKWRGDRIKKANFSAVFLPPPRCFSDFFFPRLECAAKRSHFTDWVKGSGGSKPHGPFGSLAGRQFPGLKGSAVGCLRNWQPLGFRRGMFFRSEGEAEGRLGGVSCGLLAGSGQWQFANSAVPARARWACTHYATRRRGPEALEGPGAVKPPDRFIRKRSWCNVSQLLIL